MQTQESKKALGGADLFSTTAIGVELLEMGYPEKSLASAKRCGKPKGDFILKSCNCASKVIPLSYSCNLRTCPNCSLSRKKRIRRAYLPFLNRFKVTKSDFFYFLTISPKNYEDLAFALKDLGLSFRKFRHTRYVKERIKAGVYVIETKESSDGSFNVHIHAIVYGRYLDNRIRGRCLDCGQNLIKKSHKSMTFYCANHKCNSSNLLVKEDSKIVRLFKKVSKRDTNIHISRIQGNSFLLNYMLKYVSVNKGDFSSTRNFAKYMVLTHKKPLIHAFGLFWKNRPVKVPFYCKDCGGEIVFTFDLELISHIYSKRSSLPAQTILKIA